MSQARTGPSPSWSKGTCWETVTLMFGGKKYRTRVARDAIRKLKGITNKNKMCAPQAGGLCSANREQTRTRCSGEDLCWCAFSASREPSDSRERLQHGCIREAAAPPRAHSLRPVGGARPSCSQPAALRSTGIPYPAGTPGRGWGTDQL